jgi:hypothetical protein
MVRRTTLLRRPNGARFGLQGRFADVRRFRRAARRLESHGSPAALKRASRYRNNTGEPLLVHSRVAHWRGHHHRFDRVTTTSGLLPAAVLRIVRK